MRGGGMLGGGMLGRGRSRIDEEILRDAGALKL